jgi:Ca2+-binding EF-hand superfamily protein
VFRRFDLDNSGKIDHFEMRKALAALGFAASEVS